MADVPIALADLRDLIDDRRGATPIRVLRDEWGIPGLPSIMNGPLRRRLRADEADRLAACLGVERARLDGLVSAAAERRVQATVRPRRPRPTGKPTLRRAFGGWLAAECSEFGIGKGALSDATGLPVQRVDAWFRGALMPSEPKLVVIAQMLGRDVDSFLATVRGLRYRAGKDSTLKVSYVRTLLDAVPSAHRGTARRVER